MQRRERGVVEAAGHRQSGQRESDRQRRRSLREGQHRERERANRGSARQREAPAARVDQPSGGRCGQSGDEEADREAAEYRDVADAEVAADGRREHGDRIVRGCPMK